MSFLHDLDPIPCGPRTISATYFGGKLISTVRLTDPWYKFDGTKLSFETAVFDRQGTQVDECHYRTRKEARSGHWDACRIYLQSQ